MRVWPVLMICACTRAEPVPEPPPVIVERPPSVAYACDPPEPPPVPTKVIAVENDRAVLDDKSCVTGAFASDDLGSWSLYVTSRTGSSCTFDFRSGGARLDRCTWDVGEPKSIAMPRGKDQRAPVVEGCTQVHSTVQSDSTIPGTAFRVAITPPPNERAPSPTTPIARGTMYRLGYQLFGDREHSRPSTLTGAKGELVFRYGTAAVGQGIEHVLDVARGSADVVFRPEVAQGIREKVALAPDTELCVRISVLDATPPVAPPPVPTTCAATEEWMCQLGPTSVDRTSSARGCGCGHRICPNDGSRWTIDAGGIWPDGARKLSYECIDRQERTRRMHALHHK